MLSFQIPLFLHLRQAVVKASSGKGSLTLCRHLVQPIHDRLREINEAEMTEYRQRLAEYNAA